MIVGHGAYDVFGYDDNFGWDGSYDRIVVIEMDNKDLAVSSIDISPQMLTLAHLEKVLGKLRLL